MGVTQQMALFEDEGAQDIYVYIRQGKTDDGKTFYQVTASVDGKTVTDRRQLTVVMALASATTAILDETNPRGATHDSD